MGTLSFRSDRIGPTAKRLNHIAQGKPSAALGWRLGKNCEGLKGFHNRCCNPYRVETGRRTRTQGGARGTAAALTLGYAMGRFQRAAAPQPKRNKNRVWNENRSPAILVAHTDYAISSSVAASSIRPLRTGGMRCSDLRRRGNTIRVGLARLTHPTGYGLTPSCFNDCLTSIPQFFWKKSSGRTGV